MLPSTFNTSRGSRPTIGTPMGAAPTFKPVVGLSVDDKAYLDDWRRRLTRAEDAAKNEWKLGAKDNKATFTRNYNAAQADRDRGQVELAGVNADAGFADSPALAARGLVHLAAQQEAARQRFTLDRTTADAALRKIYNTAHTERTTGMADIARESARRRNYQSMINRIGG